MKWREMSSHRQRLATAFTVGVPLIVVLGWGPAWSWAVLVTAASAVGLWEFQRMVLPLDRMRLVVFLLCGLLMPAGASMGGAFGLHLGLTLSLFLALTFVLVTSPTERGQLSWLGTSIMGFLYIPYLLSYVLLIERAEAGRAWVFLVFMIVAASDAGAYYSGGRWGRKKLYEAVSPKKTVEGSLGGMTASVLTGTLFGLVFTPQVPLWGLLLLSLILGVAGQTGDLFESMIKRMCGVKDSGVVFPGHGGILDRLDSLLFSFPVAWFFMTLIKS